MDLIPLTVTVPRRGVCPVCHGGGLKPHSPSVCTRCHGQGVATLTEREARAQEQQRAEWARVLG